MGRPPDGGEDAARLVPMAIVFYGLLLAAALVWTHLEGRSVWLVSEGAAPRGVRWLREAALGLGVALAWVVVSRVLTSVSAAGRALGDALARLLGRPGPAACLVLAATSGVAEEAFFRGALQPRVGLVAASLIFACAHFAPRREFLPWPLFALAAGLSFGLLFQATGNLVAPIVAHAGVNALNLRWLARRA